MRLSHAIPGFESGTRPHRKSLPLNCLELSKIFVVAPERIELSCPRALHSKCSVYAFHHGATLDRSARIELAREALQAPA